ESLLTNAARFTRNGVVTVSARLEGSSPGSAVLALEVEDTGPGMTVEQVERLFEPFMKGDSTEVRDVGDTGLAITLARRHAELMGGSLRVESAIGVGTRFRLRLPVEEIAAPADGLSLASAASKGLPSEGRGGR